MTIKNTTCLLAAALIVIASGCTAMRTAGDKVGSALGLNPAGNNDRSLDPDELLDPLGARDGDRLLIDDLAPSQIATTWKTRFGSVNGKSTAVKQYEQGQALYQRGVALMEQAPDGNQHQAVFTDAANKFRLASAAWSDSAIDEDALYFQGESYFFADRYVQANRAFEKLVAVFDGSKHMDMAENRRYSIALYWLQLSETQGALALNDPKRPKLGLAKEARRILHQIRMDDPTGRLADDSAMSLAKAFMKAKMYYEAADTLEDLRKNYPASEYQFDAHMLELEAQLASYQGASYDDGPLKKSDKLLKSIVKTFPQQAQGELAYLEKQSAKIQNLIGERDLTLGEYFERRGENLAARFHYQKVQDQFDGTAVAEEVETRIAEAAKKPDRPGQHAKWLVDLFPDPAKAKPVIIAGDNESILGSKLR